MNLTVVLDGETHVVSPKPGDLVRFERQYNISAASLDKDVKLEHVFFIAWSALKRTGVFTDDFEAFLDLADVGNDPAPFDPPAPPA